MNAYRFAALPSNSSVASFVTMAVSLWFLVAAAAILTDPVSVYTQSPGVKSAPAYVESVRNTVEIAPQARHTIIVSAKRPAVTL